MKRIERRIQRVWPRPIPKLGDRVYFGSWGIVVGLQVFPEYGKRGFSQGIVKIQYTNPEDPVDTYHDWADLYAVAFEDDIVEVEV